MSETWVINEKPELIQEPAIYFDVNMKTNMRDETGQIIEILASIIEFKDYTTISTENFPILEIDTTDEENPEYIWCSEEPLLIRTWEFLEPPTGDLLTWLQANATKQSSASKPCFAFFNSKFIISSSTSIPNSSLGVLTNNGAMMNDGKIVVKGSGDGWETKVIPTIVS